MKANDREELTEWLTNWETEQLTEGETEQLTDWASVRLTNWLKMYANDDACGGKCGDDLGKAGKGEKLEGEQQQ